MDFVFTHHVVKYISIYTGCIYNAACMNFSILSNENIACLLLLYLLHLGVK